MAEHRSTSTVAGEHASAGAKHQTKVDEPDTKRIKTERQTTLDDSNDKSSKKDEKTTKHEEDQSDKQEADDKPSSDGALRPGEETEVPSSILEKGIIYFFIRGRVNVDQPKGVKDIARSYIILRPIARDAKLGEGTISDAGNSRLLALPKKVLPSSGRDRFMAFVEKSGASFDEIKGQFLAGADYTTKTVGTRHTPAATPVGEGIYAITTTGRESHLVYLLTLPEKLDEVQTDLGIKKKGSFILSTKNPKYPGPANARLPEGPKFSKKIQDEFRDLRWYPSKPEHLNYKNSQLLLIGESSGIDKAVRPQEEDEKNGKEEPIEVLEKLEEEDLARMQHLPGDQSASIYADLHAHAEDYPKLQTTF